MDEQRSDPKGQRRGERKTESYVRPAPAKLPDVVVVKERSSVVRNPDCDTEREEREEGDPPPIELLSHVAKGSVWRADHTLSRDLMSFAVKSVATFLYFAKVVCTFATCDG